MQNKILQLATSLRNQNKTTLKTTRNMHILNADVAQTVCSLTIVMFTLNLFESATDYHDAR